MGGTVFTQFYWSDHSDDKGLKLCSLAAQGLWMRMLCVAADHEPIGFVAVGKRKLELADIATLGGVEPAQAEALLGELERNRVFSRDRKGCIYSRRMVRDAQSSAKNRRNGKKGGNPSLLKDAGKLPPDKPPDNGGLKPQEPEARSQKQFETFHRDSMLRGGRPSSPDAAAAKKRAWENRIAAELRRTLPDAAAERIIDAYQRGDPDAKRVYEAFDQKIKARKRTFAT